MAEFVKIGTSLASSTSSGDRRTWKRSKNPKHSMDAEQDHSSTFLIFWQHPPSAMIGDQASVLVPSMAYHGASATQISS
ncbi:unnamed protein product, partial [Amoebophrya sp. A25]|eukprot:GSA25T00007370001.1